MSVTLWFLQILLALHTAIGAIWKSSNGERTVPTLAAIPHGVWSSLIGLELFCAFALVAPLFSKRLALLSPVAAVLIAAEMLFFSGVHLASGSTSIGPVIYWLVAAVGAFIAYGRLALAPIRQSEFA